MMKINLKILLILLLSLAVVSCSGGRGDGGGSAISTIGVGEYNKILESNRGKVLVINVFATWCPPCKDETPDFVNYYKYKGGTDVEIVGLSIDKRKSDIDAFIVEYKMNYPVYHITDTVQRRLMADRVPTTIIYTPSGEYYQTVKGAITATALDLMVSKAALAK